MDDELSFRPVDPRIYFVIVVFAVILILLILGDLYKTLMVVSVTTSTLVASLAIIGIFNHGDLHKGKKPPADQTLADRAVRTYTAGYRSRPYQTLGAHMYKPTIL